jgi:hypothetical protein
MRKVRKRLWLIALLLIYVAIAIAGFVIAYIVKKDFLPNTASSAAPQASVVKQIPAPSGWKTYTNSDIKIRFYYPSEDTIKTSSYGLGVTSVALQDSKGNTDFQILLLPKSLAQTVGQDFDDYYAMQDNATKVIKNPLSQDNTTEKFTKIRNRSIDGLQALDYQSISSNALANIQPEIGTFISTGSNLILISTGSENKTKLEEMLSSFTYQQ